MQTLLTTYEASKKADLAIAYIRQLLARGKLRGRLAKINDSKAIWLVDAASLKKFLATPRKTGPKRKKI